jgi:protein-S-isoprenylcysteine O-methyltransferase Ste14
MSPYIANLTLVWFFIVVYRLSDYYVTFLRAETQSTLLYLALGYTGFGFGYYLYKYRNGITSSPSKGQLILRGLYKTIRQPLISPRKNLTHIEKTAILFAAVKVFFLPLMLNFFFGNLSDVLHHLSVFPSLSTLFTAEVFNATLFPFLIALIFTIDTLYFVFGYTVESQFLENTVRSVEPTLLGWIVTLASYPPFNGYVTIYLLWYANDFLTFNSVWATVSLRIAILCLLVIYVWASIALGAKCSNLTNRGIVARFPYSLIRHPAYVSKNLAWWLTVIPLLNPAAYISMAGWSLIYYLRAITEERHLNRDPEYKAYAQKVRYKFIPGLW